ncbi:unnamed protein product [Mucor hiemalis]
MLAFTKHEFSSGRKGKLKAMPLVTSLIILATVTVLVTMFDAYFLQRAKALISPLQRNNLQNCVMSYSYATYIDIAEVDSKFNGKYRLKLFRDGYRDDNRLYGRPALFIPGQAGSYGQVRSLASTTTNTFHENSYHGRNLDFFTVDLNEELSALNGQNLLDQAKFLNEAIKTIINLYQDPKPNSVMIIGHSMGGIVARAMPMLANYKQNSVNTIITIATPHLTAPLLLDSITYKTYNDITLFWKQHQSNLLKDIVIISIAGGSLDNIIHSDGVNIDAFIPKSHGFTTYTTSIPNVWTGSDHMAILWCNQFVRILATTLLEIDDTSFVKERMKIFRYHLLKGGSSSSFEQRNIGERIGNLKQRVLHANDSSLQLIFSNKATEPLVTMISASHNLEFLTNIPQRHDNRLSFVLCKGSDFTENACRNFNPRVVVLPSATAENLVGSTPYRLMKLNKEQKQGCDFIGIIDYGGHAILDGENVVFLKGYRISESPSVHNYSIWDMATKGAHIHVDQEHSSHVFPFIRNSLLALDVKVLAMYTSNRKPDFKPMMQQAINGKELKYYRGLEKGMSDRITFHEEPSQNNAGLSLKFYLDDEGLDISIHVDWYGTLGRTVLRYGIMIVSYFWMVTLVVVLSQLYSYVANGKSSFPQFQVSLYKCLGKSVLQIGILLLLTSIAQVYSFQWIEEYPSFTNLLGYILLGKNDWTLLFMVLFAFGLAVGLTFTIWVTISVIVYILSVLLGFLPDQVKISFGGRKGFVVHLTIVVGLLAFIPSSVIFTIYCIFWLFMTVSARRSARSDLPTVQNVYNYRISWLLLLISLLPYSIPGVIAFIKDLMIGWVHHEVSYLALTQNMPSLLLVIYLVTIGKSPDHLEAK